MKRTETSKLKQKFRGSKVWKDFRKQLISDQKVDVITLRKLSKTANCHHKILTNDMDVYTDLSDESHYVMLNSSTHDYIHWMYTYYKKDPDILNRIKNLLDEMVELNGDH